MFFQLRQFLRFYFAAVTKYQLHSPFVFDLAMAVLEDPRWFYAFDDVELLRQAALDSDVTLRVTDYGTGSSSFSGKNGTAAAPYVSEVPLREIARRSASSAEQGQALFRLADWAKPRNVLELGTSLGFGTLYLAMAAQKAQVISLEGCSECAAAARSHFEMLKIQNTEVLEGPFEATLETALKKLQTLDFVFIDGNHRREPTLAYFEQCLAFSHEKTVFVFDDAHHTPDMEAAWQHIRQHPRVTLTVDFFDLSLAFINPDFKEKQHWQVIRSKFKPWMFW